MSDEERLRLRQYLLRQRYTGSIGLSVHPIWPWRWEARLFYGGEFVDDRLALTRRGAQRKAARWADRENAEQESLVDDVIAEVSP